MIQGNRCQAEASEEVRKDVTKRGKFDWVLKGELQFTERKVIKGHSRQGHWYKHSLLRAEPTYFHLSNPSAWHVIGYYIDVK